MKIDTTLAVGRLEDVGKVARRAEEMGFSGIFTAEAMQTPYLPLALAATETQEIQLGTAIAVAFPRSPMVHAMTAWDLHKLSHGRCVLGLGTQIRKHNERRFSVPFDPPGPRLRDMLLAIRHIWDCFDGVHPLGYQGEYYTCDYMQPFFNPGPSGFGQPKLFIAAVGPYMCRLAGEVCDGMHIHPFHTRRYIEEIVRPNVEKGLSKAGRSPDDFEYATAAFILAGSEKEQEFAAGIARAQIAFYGSTPTYRRVFELAGRPELQQQLNNLVRQGKMAEMAGLIDDELLEQIAITGERHEIAAKIKARCAGLVDRVSLVAPFAPDAELFEDVVRQLQED
jgi:probable F420-dependent oxidoreductase